MSDTSVLFETMRAKPFLKWAGGKGQLITEIDNRLPLALRDGKIKNYVEPFLGGGAVFFHLAQKYTQIETFYLNDTNIDLVNCYRVVKDSAEELISRLQEIERIYLHKDDDARSRYYYEIRDHFNHEKSKNPSVLTVARMLFLNRTCFNGLYRVNRKNLFNVPSGKYRNPLICNPDNIRSASSLLTNATITCGDFEDCIQFIDSSSFVYLDPPYRPISKSASFTSYAQEDFLDCDQIRLADFCRRIHQRGAFFLLSNSDPQNEDPDDYFFEEHYSGFKLERVKASRAINCKGSKRGHINEIIVTN